MSNSFSGSKLIENRPSNQFRIPVQREPVTLTLHDGSVHEGVRFRTLNDGMDDPLESTEQFFPIEVGGAVRLYSRLAIGAMSFHAGEAAELGAMCRRAVLVRLRSGVTLQGELCFAAEEGRSRSVDQLNDGTKSFVVHEGARVHHVAKAHVEHVAECRGAGR